MFTPLRRFEFGKMLLNIIPVLIGSAFIAKIFTDYPWSVRISFSLIVAGVCLCGFFFLPGSLSKEEKEGGEA